MGNGSLSTITGGVLTLTDVMSWQKALTYYHCWICFWWGMIQTSNCPLVEWMPGSWIQSWTRFGWRPVRHLWVSLRLKASMIGCRRTVPLAFALQLRKCTENLSQVADQCCLLHVASIWPPCRIGLDWPAVHPSSADDREGLQTALGRSRCFASWRTKGFRASVSFESLKTVLQNSVVKNSMLTAASATITTTIITTTAVMAQSV
jgi:hypothetical protein